MGSGGNDRAQRRAEQQEAERQRVIAQGTTRVNSIFDSPDRQGQIRDVGNATRQFLTGELNDKKSETDRQLMFAMARGGLTGSSIAADKGREVGKTYQRGLAESERRAQAVEADLMGQDTASRQNLLAMIQSGLDMNSASTQATHALRNNLASARADATAGGIGDMFGMFGDIFRASRENAARRQAERYAYNTIYQSGLTGRPGGR